MKKLSDSDLNEFYPTPIPTSILIRLSNPTETEVDFILFAKESEQPQPGVLTFGKVFSFTYDTFVDLLKSYPIKIKALRLQLITHFFEQSDTSFMKKPLLINRVNMFGTGYGYNILPHDYQIATEHPTNKLAYFPIQCEINYGFTIQGKIPALNNLNFVLHTTDDANALHIPDMVIGEPEKGSLQPTH